MPFLPALSFYLCILDIHKTKHKKRILKIAAAKAW
jgi:hypothetical protein